MCVWRKDGIVFCIFPPTDILLSEYKTRFKDSDILPLLNLLPSAVLDQEWSDKVDEWIDAVYEAGCKYSNLLSAPLTRNQP